jgi:uncharacterized protein
MNLQPFHLAIKVRDIAEARAFYGGLLGCAEGRSAETWVDFDFYGHQLVCHQAPDAGAASITTRGRRPGAGAALRRGSGDADWQALADRLQAAGTRFVIEPHVRFRGQPGEQATLFFLDPSGNALEFKSFADIEGQLFAAEAPVSAPAPPHRAGRSGCAASSHRAGAAPMPEGDADGVHQHVLELGAALRNQALQQLDQHRRTRASTARPVSGP